MKNTKDNVIKLKQKGSEYYPSEVEVVLPFDSKRVDYGTYNNIRKAARLCHDKVIKPGETFSFHETLGERTPERWSYGQSIINGRIQKDIGGGICYVATALYQLALETSNIDIVQRYQHSYKQWYANMGADAMIYVDTKKGINKDFKIKNNTLSNIYIWMRLSDQDECLTAKFISSNEYTIRRGSTLTFVDKINPKVKFIKKENIEKPYVIEPGEIGGTATVYHNQKKISQNYYKPKDMLIAISDETEIKY